MTQKFIGVQNRLNNLCRWVTKMSMPLTQTRRKTQECLFDGDNIGRLDTSPFKKKAPCGSVPYEKISR
jgi:hypothetical protein